MRGNIVSIECELLASLIPAVCISVTKGDFCRIIEMPGHAGNGIHMFSIIYEHDGWLAQRHPHIRAQCLQWVKIVTFHDRMEPHQ